ncbi:MAG: 4-hydroxy-tetrahydrodipicolinate synthase [Myxococcota bacterium]
MALELAGIHTAIVTPFRDDGGFDESAFERLMARQADNGIHGVVACGTTGEMPTLDRDEWTAVVRAALRVGRGKMRIAAGVGTNDTRSTVRNVEAAAALGVDYAMAVLPYYNRPNMAGLRAHVRAATAVGLPLMLYHVPGRTAQRLEVAQLAELAAIDGVVAVKEATGDVRYGTDLVARTRAAVLSGDDYSFVGAIAQGMVGCVSVLSNVAPAETVAVYDAVRAGRLDDARARLFRLWDLAAFLFSDASPAPTKAALATLGLCTAQVRLPIAPFGGPPPTALVQAALSGADSARPDRA